MGHLYLLAGLQLTSSEVNEKMEDKENPKCPEGHEMIRDYPNLKIEWVCPTCGHMEPYKKKDIDV